MSEPDLNAPTSHKAGCLYGGFSCGYWMVVDGCTDYHPETHIIVREDGTCACGHRFPGAGWGKIVSDFHDRELPDHLQAGIGSPIEREINA